MPSHRIIWAFDDPEPNSHWIQDNYNSFIKKCKYIIIKTAVTAVLLCYTLLRKIYNNAHPITRYNPTIKLCPRLAGGIDKIISPPVSHVVDAYVSLLTYKKSRYESGFYFTTRKYLHDVVLDNFYYPLLLNHANLSAHAFQQFPVK